MTADEMRDIMELVKYPGYQFLITEEEGQRPFLRAGYWEPDIVTGEPSFQQTRKWRLSPHMTKSELVQTAFKCIITSAEHRVREGFKFAGQRVYSPHFDVEALVQLSKDKRFDYRKDPQ